MPYGSVYSPKDGGVADGAGVDVRARGTSDEWFLWEPWDLLPYAAHSTSPREKVGDIFQNLFKRGLNTFLFSGILHQI